MFHMVLKSQGFQGSAAKLQPNLEQSSYRPGKQRNYLPGTRIRAEEIVLWHHGLGMSPEQIIARHPTLSAASIEAALACYREHHSETPLPIQPADTLASPSVGRSARLNQRSP
jgi:hypothetical protein